MWMRLVYAMSTTVSLIFLKNSLNHSTDKSKSQFFAIKIVLITLKDTFCHQIIINYLWSIQIVDRPFIPHDIYGLFTCFKALKIW